MKFSITLFILWSLFSTALVAVNASPLPQDNHSLDLAPRDSNKLQLFLLIYRKSTEEERWGLSFDGGYNSFVPKGSLVPYSRLDTGKAIRGYSTGAISSSSWQRVDLDTVMSTRSKKDKMGVLEAMGEIEMENPQSSYGGPPLTKDMYAAGGTSMNYVRKLLEYLLETQRLENNSGEKLLSLPTVFEEEFKRYPQIWTTRWKGTGEGDPVAELVKNRFGVDLYAEAPQ